VEVSVRKVGKKSAEFSMRKQIKAPFRVFYKVKLAEKHKGVYAKKSLRV
jgi:hypothetical protein